MGKYLNFGKVTFISVVILILYSGQKSAENIESEIMEENGF